MSIIKVKVKVNKPKTEIIEEKDGIYYLNVKAKPVKGEANKEIIKFFSKKFNKKVRIISGLKSNLKILRLD